MPPPPALIFFILCGVSNFDLTKRRHLHVRFKFIQYQHQSIQLQTQIQLIKTMGSYKHHTICKRGSAETSPMNLEIASQSSLCLRKRRTKRSSFHPCRLAMSILTRRRLVPAVGTTVQTTTSFGVPSKSQYELWDKDMPLRQSMASIIGIATNSQRNFQEKREPQECDTGWAGWADGHCYLCPRANVLIASLSTNAMSSLEKGRLYWLHMLCIGTLVKEGCFGVEVFDVV